MNDDDDKGGSSVWLLAYTRIDFGAAFKVLILKSTSVLLFLHVFLVEFILCVFLSFA
jgi:hypothetical protein